MMDDEKAKALAIEACKTGGAYTTIWAVSEWMENVLLETPHIKNHPMASQRLTIAIQELRQTANGMLL